MNFKKTLGFLTALCMIFSLCQFSFAASPSSYENRDDAIFIGFEGDVPQYLEIGEDMNGYVGSSTNDKSPVPSYAKYTNGFYVQGVQLRTETSGWFWNQTSTITGTRFVIVNNVDMISKMVDAGLTNIVYGSLIQVDTGFNLNVNNAVSVKAENIYESSDTLKTDYQKFTVCITDVDVDNLRTNIAVRPYLTYTDLSGNTQTIYGEQYSCNVYAVAYRAYHFGSESPSVKTAIKDKILTHFTAENGSYIPSNEFVLDSASAKTLVNKLRKTTDKKIAQIKSTPNLEIPDGATVYYVSNNGNDSNDGTSPDKAWATLSKVSNAALSPGDYVLFERGGYFRGSFGTKEGVTYSAYGEGEKPVICGSTEDGADPSKWKNVGGNIWVYQTAFDKDVGTLVFNHGEAHAIKWLVFQNKDGVLEEYKTKTTWNGVTTMTEDLHFWHSTSNNKIYLCSKENPGERFESIEFLRRVNAIGVGGNNVTLDNLCVKYTGAHGAGGGTKSNFTVQNCEFGWIGGSIQFITYNYSGSADRPTRYGNAIEIYGGCDGFTVENCYFYQIYDAAVTHQYQFDNGSTDQTDVGHYNVTVKDNVMEYCVYSIEYFLGRIPDGNPSYMDNVLYENNYMWYAGEGLGSQRPDNTTVAHIKGWTHLNYVKNFVVKNNVMVYSARMFLHSSFINKNSNSAVGVKLVDNILIGNEGQKFGAFEYGYNVSYEGHDYIYGTVQNRLGNLSNGDKFYFIKE